MGNRKRKAERWQHNYAAINNQPYIMMRQDLLSSPHFYSLSGNAQKVFNYLAGQYRGGNNGNLSCPKSAAELLNMTQLTMRRALKELEDAEFLIVSRQGGKNQCSLYALTCFRIDDCGHDLPSTSRAPDDWKRRHYELSPAPALKPH
ncbi:hypothetical protein [Eikenella corrodens]|uniref:hypothetical protein n=1 Tax=Eikenella corrodens TaxID=539 RepID=UPI0028EFA712|nr:hypothetical protein [Eikenella corrodens]